jgi:hypothetical protein
MSGWVLLIIGLASLALIIAMAAWAGAKVWRVARRGMAMSRAMGPLAADVAERAGRLEVNVAQLQSSADQLQVSLARLQASAERLRIIAEAWAEAMTPYRSVRAFFGR